MTEKSDECKRCKGTGIVKNHIRVQGGRCFRCGGSGKESDYKNRKAAEKARAEYEKTPEYKAEYKAHLEKIRKSHNLYEW